ncbi:MAG TPA: L-lactate dehydrogenase [Patescibacteria group bacterium]|nr:L-lactate dehydrogenase [Patescibacteria group bacterium]
MNTTTSKVGIVGLGNVGATAAYALLLTGLVDELVLYARTKEKAVGEKLDLEHGLAFLDKATITATDDFADLAGCDIVLFTAGAAQAPGETRLDLLNKNSAIVEEVVPKIVAAAPNAILVMITNPVDILTYKASLISALPKGRVFGSGTMLDTARFRYHLGEMLNINPRSIHAYILGEHGDSSFPVLSSASVGGQPLSDFPAYSKEQALEAFELAKQAAYNIIQAKGATYYAIGVVITKLVRTILRNNHSVLPVSIPVENYYGQYNVSLSVPCIVGRDGVEQVLKAQLSPEEQILFAHSADTLKKLL